MARNAGQTADELAAVAGARFPGHATELAFAARLFNQVRYGGEAGTRDGYERLRRLDEALARQAAGPRASNTVSGVRPGCAGHRREAGR